MSSIFTKIITGQIPSYKIWEDELTFAFLDIQPITAGHVLIVPKIEVDYFVDVPEEYYQAVFKTAKKLAPAIQRATESLRVGMLVEGVEVPHFHLHLIPIFARKEFLKARTKATQQDLSNMQQKILTKL